MWIVQLALRRPYTFVVMSVLILVLGIVSIETMSTDIFPPIDIPVVSVVWSYSGTSPDEMEKRFTTISERSMTTAVNDIEHIESQSVSGVSVIKVFFQPGTRIDAAVAQVTAVNQTILRILPTGTTPPFILQFSASNVPILQAVLSSPKLSEADLYDLGLNFLRVQLATVQGAQVPSPYGGKARQIMVDLDPQALYSKGLSPSDVVAALTAQNLILPAGDAKVGTTDYTVRTNASPQVVGQLNDIPVKQVNGVTIYMRDVAQVHEGFAVQQSIVRVNGRRSTLMTILKSSNASTLDIVKRVRERLPAIVANMPPPAPEIKLLFDQSIFVKAALQGVVKEAVIAASLTAIMILLFLGSWRSTVIIAISIPLSILVSIITLKFLGQTLNTMTLGGLGLAVGILVDDATVEIENIHRNLGLGKPIQQAILDGAQQIAVPAFVSTLSICIVFVPGRLPVGCGKKPVHSPRHGSRLRHAGQLSALANPGSHHGRLPPEKRGRRLQTSGSRARRASSLPGGAGSHGARTPLARLHLANPLCLQSLVRASAHALPATAGLDPDPLPLYARLVRHLPAHLLLHCPVHRPRLLPGRRRRQLPSARAHPARHPALSRLKQSSKRSKQSFGRRSPPGN